MECKECGYKEYGMIFWQPVMPDPPVTPLDQSDRPEELPKYYKMWACPKCGRYHNPDGSLYSNPYKS